MNVKTVNLETWGYLKIEIALMVKLTNPITASKLNPKEIKSLKKAWPKTNKPRTHKAPQPIIDGTIKNVSNILVLRISLGVKKAPNAVVTGKKLSAKMWSEA